MIVFCSFEQMDFVIKTSMKYGFKNYIPIIFCKNYSPQVLKANMRIVGATEYALVLFRERLPKFRNNGKMVFNWFPWERDGNEIPKIHPAQKSVKVLKRLIEIFTDEGDVVIDPVAGSGATGRAAKDLKRHFFGFEIYKGFYNRAINEMLSDTWIPSDNDIKGQMNMFDFIPAQED